MSFLTPLDRGGGRLAGPIISLGFSLWSATPLANEWYYAKDGQQYGPIASRELKQMADRGDLEPGDLVWKEGMSDWRPAEQVKGLISRSPSPQTAVADVPAVDTSTSGASSGHRRRSRNLAGPILLLFCTAPMITAMFVPWWSMSIKPFDDDPDTVAGKWATGMVPVMKARERELERAIKRIEDSPAPSDEDQKQIRKDRIEFLETVKKDRKWWDDHLKHVRDGEEEFDDAFEEIAKDVDDDEKLKLSITLWGWDEGGIALMGLIFGIVVLVFGIVFVSIPLLRNWSWTVSALALILGIVTLVLAFVWAIKAPGDDVGTKFEQGVSVGPWLLFGAGVLFFLVGLFDTIFGVIFVVRSSRSH